MKKLSFLLLILLSTGCVHNVPNPFDQMSRSQIAVTSDNQLCYLAHKSKYLHSENLDRELYRRGITDCSEGELYCRNLGFKEKTPAYAQCRFAYDNNRQQLALEESELRRERLDRIGQAFRAMAANNRHITCTTQYSGYAAYTDCN